MALDYVDNIVVTVLNFHKNRKVMVMREVSSLNLELIENFMVSCMVSPYLLNMRILEFTVKYRMFMNDMMHSLPMLLDFDVYLNLYVCHILYE